MVLSIITGWTVNRRVASTFLACDLYPGADLVCVWGGGLALGFEAHTHVHAIAPWVMVMGPPPWTDRHNWKHLPSCSHFSRMSTARFPAGYRGGRVIVWWGPTEHVCTCLGGAVWWGPIEQVWIWGVCPMWSVTDQWHHGQWPHGDTPWTDRHDWKYLHWQAVINHYVIVNTKLAHCNQCAELLFDDWLDFLAQKYVQAEQPQRIEQILYQCSGRGWGTRWFGTTKEATSLFRRKKFVKNCI